MAAASRFGVTVRDTAVGAGLSSPPPSIQLPPEGVCAWDVAEGPIAHRTLATPFLWHMTPQWEAQLKQDWEELAEKLKLYQFDELTAKVGRYLHIRPKAPNSKTFIQVLDSQGNVMKVVPKGFYLRSQFTHNLLKEHFGV